MSNCVELVVCTTSVAEAGFSDGQTKLRLHIGQVELTKFDSFKKGKKINELAFWGQLGPSAT